MRNIYLALYNMMMESSGLVLATVAWSMGSTPQKAGSSAIFRNGKLLSGTVGGGVAEGRVMEQAGICSVTGRSKYLHLVLNSDISDTGEAICGGEIDVLVDANPVMHRKVYEEISNTLTKREPGVLVTIVDEVSAEDVSVNRYWITHRSSSSLPVEIHDRIAAEAYRIIGNPDHSSFYMPDLSLPGERSSQMVFLEPVLPLPRLVIAGAGHVGKALSHIGRLLEFEVTVVDDRSEYANASNLPDADNIIVRNVGKALSEIEKDKDTYIVIVTRGHKDDAEALKPCIGSGAFYTGMIGSRTKIAKMRTEFLSKGWATEEEWEKIHAPIGIDINSVTVEEIAVSIAAELIKVRNKA
ncbi:MAG: XdhC family protein [Bacteroidales bacterium]|nr:XdhC family protein [Bacteroidales bacterium]